MNCAGGPRALASPRPLGVRGVSDGDDGGGGDGGGDGDYGGDGDGDGV